MRWSLCLVDGVFRNSRRTILGADDKAAVAALLHATELLRAVGRSLSRPMSCSSPSRRRPDLSAPSTWVRNVLSSPFAAVFDSSGPGGGHNGQGSQPAGLDAVFQGTGRSRRGRAGARPQRDPRRPPRPSRRMELGRLDEETSANIGVIHGGVASNIIPDYCEIKGECRSHDEEKLAHMAAAMVDALQEGAAQAGVDVDVTLVHEYRAFALTGRHAGGQTGKAAVTALGLEPRLLTGGGGSDANILNARGLPTVNLDAGMMQVHSPDEYLTLDDLDRLCRLTARDDPARARVRPPYELTAMLLISGVSR